VLRIVPRLVCGKCGKEEVRKQGQEGRDHPDPLRRVDDGGRSRQDLYVAAGMSAINAVHRCLDA
jgi:hypothetical protein